MFQCAHMWLDSHVNSLDCMDEMIFPLKSILGAAV